MKVAKQRVKIEHCFPFWEFMYFLFYFIFYASILIHLGYLLSIRVLYVPFDLFLIY